MYQDFPIVLINFKIARNTLKYQPTEVLMIIFNNLDPVSFCNFREVCSYFADVSRSLVDIKERQYLDDKFNSIEERRHQAWIREKNQGYMMTRNGKVSFRTIEEEGLPFGYYSDDYSPYNSDGDLDEEEHYYDLMNDDYDPEDKWDISYNN
jgi:hypothetical protein